MSISSLPVISSAFIALLIQPYKAKCSYINYKYYIKRNLKEGKNITFSILRLEKSPRLNISAPVFSSPLEKALPTTPLSV